MMSERCPWAIRFVRTLATRCFLDDGHGHRPGHRARGLPDSSKVVVWYGGDTREFRTEREDIWAWRVPAHREAR